MSAHLTGADLEAYEREWKTKGHTIFRASAPAVPAQSRLGALRESMVATRTFVECQTHCEHLNAENNRGGEARAAVNAVAHILGVKLSDDILGDGIWSVENMARAVQAAEKARDHRESLQTEVLKLRGKLHVIREAANLQYRNAS